MTHLIAAWGALGWVLFIIAVLVFGNPDRRP